VVSVADGDTFTLLTDQKTEIRIRLHGIDCPERTQDFGTVAKKFLSDKIYDKRVSVTQTDIDRYSRMIAIVTLGSENINEAMLAAGLAWHYKRYDKNPTWAALEQEARKAKTGLWQNPNPIEPWEYRRSTR
jgi:endonuclease YncB( thermonuclease family)